MKSQSFLTARSATLRLASFVTAFACLISAPSAYAVNGVSGSPVVVQFPATAVGSTSTGVVETVTITGYAGPFTFSQHYSKDYYFSGPTCTGTSPTTCTLTVYFRPTLPGVRKEAVFVFNNGTRIGSILFSGVGTAPLAALQPGVVTAPAGLMISMSGYAKTIVTDENGVVYFYNSGANSIQSCATGCSSPTTLVSNAGSIFDLTIDGAGILYWGEGGNTSVSVTTLNTYDTVQGIQGTVTLPASDLYYNTAVDGMGDIFVIGNNTQNIYKVLPNGTSTTTAVNPAINQDYYSNTDSLGNLFIGGGTINELTTSGTQTQVSTSSNGQTLGIDAADTLYIASGTVPTELAASNYNATSYTFTAFANVPIPSITSASSGTLYFGTLGGTYQINRSQDTIAFGSQTAGTTSGTLTVNMLNIGNMPLALSNIALTGTGYTLQTAATSPCTAGISLPAGASCNIAVNFNSPNAGNFPGTIVVTSNSLNNTSSTETITLTAFINGAYLTVSPASLPFNPQTIATSTSKTLTITNSGFGGSASLSGLASSNPAFTVAAAATNGCGATLAVGASCALTVTFTPTLPQSYSGNITLTGNEGSGSPPSTVTVPATGTGLPVISQTAGGSNNTIVFNNAAVGTATPQTITASFLITGETTLVTPTASMHYGLAYTAGTATCTGSIGAQTCSVPVTFTPNYPGGRRDALFLTAGGTRIVTALVYGIGTAPFALIQPGVVTNPILAGSQYLYDSTVDENGTVYVLEEEAPAIIAVTKAGVVTTLPISGLSSPRALGINGAGVLYIADQNAGPTTTYDTVQGLQGSIPYPTTPPSGTIQTLAVGNLGNVYENNLYGVYTVTPSGSTTYTAYNPVLNPAPSEIVTDSSDNVFLSGSKFYEMGASAQTILNTTGSPGNSGFQIDAAGTLYSGRYGAGGIGEVTPALNYNAAVGYIDPTGPVLGVGVGPDGTVYGGDYLNLDKVDRSQGLFTFNALNLTQTATPQVATVYNGGNMPLTITSLTLSGDPDYTLTANTCTSATVIAPGAICTVTVNFTAPGHGGIFTGNIALVTNSLNTTVTNNIALTDTVQYPYVTVSPTSLTFGNQAVGTTSAAQTVTFTNSGDAVANLYSANVSIGGTITNQYTLTLAAGCTSIAIGGTCTGSVVFKPTAAATVNATGNAYQGNFGTPSPVTFTVTGTGVAAAPAVTFAPTSFGFGNQTAGTFSAATTIQLTNSGNASLTLTGITLTGTNPGNFILIAAATNPCTSTITLAAAASCNLSVLFNPNVAGTLSANISVADNATPSPQTVPLTGTGTITPTPQLQFTPAQLNFFAGTGVGSVLGAGNGGPALSATFDAPASVAQDAAGNTYIADQDANTVRKIDINGNITLFAGVPSSGGSFGGDNGPAVSALLNNPIGLAVDSYGNLYIADFGNLRIRKVVPATGIITTYVGNGSGFFNGSPGPNTPIPGAEGICFDPSGNLYLATTNASLVIKVTPALAVSVFAGNFGGMPNGIAGYTGDNIAANIAGVNFPTAVASDQSGNIYIADTNNYRVRKVAVGTGIITTVAGNGTAPGTTVAGDGGAATSAVVSPGGVATDLAGDLFISTSGGLSAGYPNVVRKVGANGIINTVAGGGSTQSIGGEATANSFGGLGLPSIANNGSIFTPSFAYNITQDAVFIAGPAGYLQFGNQTVSTTSAPQTITFENTSNTSLSLTSSTYTASGNFAVTGGTCPANSTLAPGITCTLTVTFTPGATGVQNGTISVPSSAGTQTIYLQGTGVTATAAQATLNPPTVTFSPTAVGTSAVAQVLTVGNPGNATLTGITVSVTGANPTDFSETTTCPATLAAGTSCTISVIFTPLSGTTFNASVSVVDSVGTQASTLTGTGTAPQAALSPALTFASTTVGTTTAAQTVTLTNAGNAALPITSASTTNSQFAISANTCGSLLAAGATCTYSITFTPNATGAQAASLSVVDSVGTQTVALSGTGTPAPTPQAALTSGLSFAPTPVGTSAATQTLTLSNQGGAALTITSIVAAGAGFSQTNNCGASVAASAACSIIVTFTPGSATALSGTVTVTDNATPTTQSATLSGTGTAPQAALTATVAFPSTVVGTTATAITASLTNAGNAALPITSASVTNAQFVISANTCGSSLAAGASCTYSITFTPTSTGAQTATLSVVDSLGTQTAALSGTGTAAQAALSPTTFTFASTFMGTPSAPQVFTLSNPGTATLTGIAISLTGANPTDYSETTTCAATLAAAATCTISVTFTPAGALTYTANLNVTESLGSVSATLSGTGNSSTGFTVVAPNPTQSVDPGGTAIFNINVNTLTGNFTLPVTLSASGLPPGATYTFNPASVIPGTTGAASVLTIQTSPTFALRSPSSNPALRMPLFAILALIPLAGLRRIRRKLRALSPGLRLLTLILLSLAAILPLSGCGSGGYFGSKAQAFVITVTGTSTASTQSTTVTLNLQ